MSKDNFLDYFETEFRASKQNNDKQIGIIEEWVKQYDGELYGNEVEGSSKIVWKLMQKLGETLISNLVKPFIGSSSIVETDPLTKNDTYKSKIYEKLLNHFISKDFNKNEFIKTIGKMIVKEGTCFVRVGWNRVENEKKIKVGHITPEIKQKIDEWNATVEQVEDGFIITKKTIEINRPDAKVCKNEDIFIDPTADTFEESRFLIYKYTTSLSELKSQPELYSQDAVSKLEQLIKQGANDINHSATIHEANEEELRFEDKARTRVTLYEYWGEYDIDGDGYLEPVVATIAEESFSKKNVVLKLKKNPFPFGKIPFVRFVYINDEFKIWGKGIADVIDNEQKLMTAFMRGIIDNAANSNNGKTFIKKKALDPVNFQRYMNGERLIEVNTNEPLGSVIKDGNYNELPSSIYNMLNIVESNAEALVGVSKAMQGIPGTEVKSAASNFSAVMSQSQIRLLDITNNITVGLRSMMFMWLEMCMAYLTDEEIDKITGINIPELKVAETQKLIKEFGLEELPPDTQAKAINLVISEVEDMFSKKTVKTDITIKVGTDGLKQIKLQSINMLMQQAAPLVEAGAVPPDSIKELFAEMAELMDFPKLADKTRKFNRQPSEEEIMAQQLDLQMKQAEVAKSMALAENAKARSANILTKTKKDEAGIEPETAKKYMEVAEAAKKVQKEGKDESKNS